MIRLSGGRLIDPANGPGEQKRDIFIEGGKIVAAPADVSKVERSYDITGKIVMAGAIDLHSHLAGGKVNLARMLMTKDHFGHAHGHGDTAFGRSGGGHCSPTSFTTGYRYAEMGYAAAFEPAMVPANARASHLEMADMPLIDRGAYVMLGNDDLLLRMIASGGDQEKINDYIAWMIGRTQAIGVKTVNPGGISAFKFNGRHLGIDEQGPHFGVTPRRIVYHLARAVKELGLTFPLHTHANNLGVPGNIETTLQTVAAAEGYPIHLTHVQFHSYGTEGDRHFSSAAAQIAQMVNTTPNVTVDVGQIMFGQTVTASGDTMSQYRQHAFGDPKKWICMDIECDGGCGLVPFRYRDQNFVNALQWAIGLELFLLIEDPWRVFLTTDHPNGAPLTCYPMLIRLLMDRTFRNDCLAHIHKGAQEASILGSITREYTLEEIAILTRASPAKLLGLGGHGHLGIGAAANVTVYTEQANKEEMFMKPAHVFKNGVEVVRDHVILSAPMGATHVVRPVYDATIETTIRQFFDDHMTVGYDHFGIAKAEIEETGSRVIEHALNPRVVS